MVDTVAILRIRLMTTRYQCEEYVHSGVRVDTKLSFSDHFRYVTQKSYLLLNSFRKAFLTRDKQLHLQVYKSYVRPYLEYAASVCSPYKLTDIDSIESVQRNFSKRIGLPRPCSYNQRCVVPGTPGCISIFS